MSILFYEKTKIFHLCNQEFSYIMMVLPNGHMGQLYCGARVHEKEDFSYLFERMHRPMTACVFDEDDTFSLEHTRQEYGVYGTTDFRHPAVEILQENGSRLLDFKYQGHKIVAGKPSLPGLPATYVEDDKEAETLIVTLKDRVTDVSLELLYTIFAKGGILARSARFVNGGTQSVQLTRAMSFCLDLPDAEYEWMQFSGAWARERHLKVRRLEQGIQAVDSLRGNSSHEHNPFIVLKRPTADENQGEVMGFSLIYSGNFLAQAQVDTHDMTRVLLGIHPFGFSWKLEAREEFVTPEAVMVYSKEGLGGMSRVYHKLYQKRLARGYWRDKERPILNNNWEATYFDFTQERLVELAKKAKECGVELFVLDDGWFGERSSDFAGLGDWVANTTRLPKGITGLAEQIEALGMKFGLWFEPEMVNQDSDLYRAHPDWILKTPDRHASLGRHQHVLDFSRREVVDAIYKMMAKILREAKVSYIKWDMNRSITECYSSAYKADRQGEIFHRYILGVYDLYERLTSEFPEVLFESCASGGGRFDPGLLYYAPQGWASDDSDAIERLKIQYGTSYVYPISSIGSHVSVVPNHQVFRNTPLHTRANVAYFGTFGYELDLNKLTEEEVTQVKAQISFMKEHRHLIQFGDFYRLSSPFEKNITAWMVVSEDKTEAIVGWYKVLNGVNMPYSRLKLQGLSEDMVYQITVDGQELSGSYYGDELMHIGLLTSDGSAGELPHGVRTCGDFDSRIYVLKA
ncbi:MAG: alpha-galactosidase [Lachnospiraceae bacterium]|nr:alpha-galactosidase [Lachnospiraceae bacterium]